MKRVFVVNNGGHDYGAATRFGELVFCTESMIRKDDTAQMFREIEFAMRDAAADDYLLISSLTTLCAIATGILANRFGEVHYLLYKDGQYVERDVIFDN